MIRFLKHLISGGDKSPLLQRIQNGALVVDVRSPQEYAGGHLPHSVNIPLDRIPMALPEIKAYNKPVVTVCRSGARSGMAEKVLQQAGIEAYNGGAWQDLKNT